MVFSGGHIVLENVRYFTVNCDFNKIYFGMKKARNPCKTKVFRTFLWQGQKDLKKVPIVLRGIWECFCPFLGVKQAVFGTLKRCKTPVFCVFVRSLLEKGVR